MVSVTNALPAFKGIVEVLKEAGWSERERRRRENAERGGRGGY